MLKLARGLEAAVRAIGRAAAWFTLFMVLLTVVVVVLRYFLDFGRIWMQELVTWAHAAVFLLGAAYTLACDEHVRVDVLYHRFGPRAQAWVNVAGTLTLLLPVCGLLFFGSARYAAKSWQLAERSPETGGLPFPLVPTGKTLLAAMCLLLILQGVAILLRNAHALRSGQFPEQRGHAEML